MPYKPRTAILSALVLGLALASCAPSAAQPGPSSAAVTCESRLTRLEHRLGIIERRVYGVYDDGRLGPLAGLPDSLQGAARDTQKALRLIEEHLNGPGH